MSVRIKADYDIVGNYSQDDVNGLSDSLLERMIELVDPAGSENILDAMGGDGNLTLRLHEYCKNKNIKIPHCTLFEISKVQTDIAKKKLPEETCATICGDILNLTLTTGDNTLAVEKYDRIMIKSANHEIPLEHQKILYKNLFSLLKPGGYFVNLGLIFDDLRERNEVCNLVKVKDKLANMKHAEKSRHFLMRDEFYENLEAVGFNSVQAKTSFNYRVSSKIIADTYFEKASRHAFNMENQAAQARCQILRKNGRIEFVKDETFLILPGEITVARKPGILSE